MIEQLHWLRPLWLLALIPLLPAWWWVVRQIHASSAWESYVDPELQPYVLGPGSNRTRLGTHLLFLTWLLGLLVLAGPVWEQQPVPVFESRPSMIAVMDVSPSMNLDDLAPTRMERAVFKLSDFLNQARGVEMGLLVFAERPYVVSPLTDDVKTLQAFLPSISTDLAPVSGSQLHLAIDKAVDLLQQAAKPNGQIVLFTDSEVTNRHITSAKKAFDAGYRVSVIGVGTRNGAPLRDARGDFVRTDSGAVIVPKVDIAEFRKLAEAGGGISTLITPGAADIDAIFKVSDVQLSNETGHESSDRATDYWVEHAVWALPVFLFLGLGFFRRGLVL